MIYGQNVRACFNSRVYYVRVLFITLWANKQMMMMMMMMWLNLVVFSCLFVYAISSIPFHLNCFCAEGNGTAAPLMSVTVKPSSYYGGFPFAPPDNGPMLSYGSSHDTQQQQQQHLRPVEPISGYRGLTPPPRVDGTRMELSDSPSSEDGDVSVCSLDTTDVLLNTRQIEAS